MDGGVRASKAPSGAKDAVVPDVANGGVASRVDLVISQVISWIIGPAEDR